MHLSPLCTLNLHYDGGFHLVRPYGNESGEGWGVGSGTVTGDRLSGEVRWSNHPTRRGDGTMLPSVRGVVTAADGAVVMLQMAGRTVFDGGGTGHQMLQVLFESESPSYAWLNDVICVADGRIDTTTIESRLDVYLCESG
jgi:hypothetical protein